MIQEFVAGVSPISFLISNRRWKWFGWECLRVFTTSVSAVKLKTDFGEQLIHFQCEFWMKIKYLNAKTFYVFHLFHRTSAIKWFIKVNKVNICMQSQNLNFRNVNMKFIILILKQPTRILNVLHILHGPPNWFKEKEKKFLWKIKNHKMAPHIQPFTIFKFDVHSGPVSCCLWF